VQLLQLGKNINVCSGNGTELAVDVDVAARLSSNALALILACASVVERRETSPADNHIYGQHKSRETEYNTCVKAPQDVIGSRSCTPVSMYFPFEETLFMVVYKASRSPQPPYTAQCQPPFLVLLRQSPCYSRDMFWPNSQRM
jgi:hypothetical protein